MPDWSFLTNHARVLYCIARDPEVRLRDIAATLSITERSAHAIVADLTHEGYVLKEKIGRRNHYRVQDKLAVRDTILQERTVTEVVALFTGKAKNRSPVKRQAASRS